MEQLNKIMKAKIIDIIGHCMEPELAELQAEEIMNLYNDSYSELLEALEIFTKQKFESSEEIDCYIFHKSHIEKAETAIKKATQ